MFISPDLAHRDIKTDYLTSVLAITLPMEPNTTDIIDSLFLLELFSQTLTICFVLVIIIVTFLLHCFVHLHPIP